MSQKSCPSCGLSGDFPHGKCDECLRQQEALLVQADDEDDEDDEDEELQGYEGGNCTRCGLALEEGLCTNDRCPFADTYQDEMVEDWKYPDDDERAFIAALRGHAKG
jgi:hypothetical protein